MKKTLTRLACITGSLLCAATASAETSATPPAGYFKLTARGGSDSLLSVPLAKRTAWMGRISDISANSVTLTLTTIPADGSASSATGTNYYAEFLSGDLAGLAYPVSGNTGAQFSLVVGDDSLIAHGMGSVQVGAAGDVVRIRPSWTLGDLFGATPESIRLTPISAFSGEVYLSGDAVEFPDNLSPGTAKKPAAVFAYIAGSGWRKRGAGEAVFYQEPIFPWTAFTVRRQSENVELLLVGYTPALRRVVRLPSVGVDQDFDVTLASGLDSEQSISTSGLILAFLSSTDEFTPADELLDFYSVRRGFSLPPAQRFHLVATNWLSNGAEANNAQLHPGRGYVLRLRGARPVKYWKQGQPTE